MINLLMVDDDDINNFLLKHLIRKCELPIESHTCTNAADAISFLKSFHADHKTIDLILLDINMPLMNGWELLDELKNQGISLNGQTLIYMLSSSVHKADIEQSKKYSEITGFISKPISKEMLSNILEKTGSTKQAIL